MFKCPIIGTPGQPVKQPQVAGRDPNRVYVPRLDRSSGPVTRPVFLDDDKSRAAFAIAQRMADLRNEIKHLEREYAKFSGTHSDPTIDLRQLQFPFAEQYVKVHQPIDIVKLFNSCTRAIS